MKKVFAFALSLAMLVSVSAPAFSAETKQIAASYGISLYFNDKQTNLTDVNGVSVQPFTYQGTTYVPIRAVSELFGASIGYDSTTNSARVYDDFSEICAVVNRMGNIVNSCYQDLLADMYSAGLGGNTNGDTVYKENCEKINRMFDALELVGEDNGNAKIITEEILDSYGAFVIDYVDCRTAYVQLKKNSSQYYVDQYFNQVHKSIDDYAKAMSDIEMFFDNYCCWRDLGF